MVSPEKIKFIKELTHRRHDDISVVMRELLEETRYLRRALTLVASDIPVLMLSSSDFKSFASVLSERILIAQRALDGQPLKGGQERTLTDAADASSVETASQKNSAADSSNAITDEGI